MRVVSLFFACLGAGGLVVASVLTLLDVALRYFGVPIDGMSEVVGLTLVGSVAAFFPLSFLEDHHLSIRYLGDGLGRLWRRRLDLFGGLATLGFVGIIAWRFLLYAGDTAHAGETTPMAGLKVYPAWWVAAAMFVLSVPVQLYVLRRLLRDRDDAVTRDVRDEVDEL
ncbi:MAG: TRAP transporter small permease [Candidatus Eiseniibacteriota bacterium]